MPISAAVAGQGADLLPTSYEGSGLADPGPSAARLAFHPLANLFPLIEGAEFDALVEDIRVHGVREPIVLLDGLILDGRNRYRALAALRDTSELRGPGWGIYAGEAVTDETIDPEEGSHWPFRKYSSLESGDPLAFVLSRNLHRRHLDESQRAMVAARLATFDWGGRRSPPPSPLRGATSPAKAREDHPAPEQAANLPLAVSQAAAAGHLNVSERSLRSAKVVQAKGTAELVRAVDQGRLAVSAAAKAAALPAEEQRRIAAEADAGRPGAVVALIKQEHRAAREAALGARQAALPERRYGVIYADPEWRFEPRSRATGMDRAADNHYPTSPTAEIAARDVGAIAAADAVLFLWATVPMLPDALAVMAAWGFAYKSHFVWKKVFPGGQKGTGYWSRNEHELLLVGVRGSPPAPAPGRQWGSVIHAPVGRHSEKPGQFADLIEAYFPTLPKIELNARALRPGWDAWGLEAPEHESDAASTSGIGEKVAPSPPQPAVGGAAFNSVPEESLAAEARAGADGNTSVLTDGGSHEVVAMESNRSAGPDQSSCSTRAPGIAVARVSR